MDNIRNQTKPACEGLKNVSYEKLELKANISFVDEMPTSDIQKVYIKTALSLVDIDAPDWTYVAARLQLYDMYHEMHRTYGISRSIRSQVYDKITLTDYLNKTKSALSYEFTMFDIDKLQATIDPTKDLEFTHLGVESLMSRYLLKKDNKIVELPQHMLMSLAMFLASAEKEDHTEWAIKFYNIMADLEYLPATPTLSNGRKLNGNCMSCAVGSTPDTIEGIFDAFKEQALGSKHGTGFGWDWTRIRALGGSIQGTRGAAGGLIPWMKLENDIAIAVDQLGVRKGAIAVSVETWHKDIIDFIDMKRNSGEDKRLAKELFLNVSASDLFMRRTANNEMFTLFDPADTPELPELFGTEFEDKYHEYERILEETPEYFTNQPVKMLAKDIWKKIQNYYWEVGMPFWFFKDNANRAHQNPELGIIRSTNLCTEIFQAANEDKTILCNLGSLNLARVNTKEDMERVIPIAMRMLDNVVDLNHYAIPKSEKNQKHTRAVGLGVCGEAELLAHSQIMYGSDKHFEFIDELYENMATISDQASRDLGTERGTWSEDSEFRNAYRRAIAPTSSISILMATTACQEATFNRVWVEENLLGNFKVTAPHIDANSYEFYINAYDVNQKDSVRAEAVRAKWIDQGASHNIYLRPGTTGKEVYETIMLAWELGLKSLYYLRSESAKLESDLDTRDTAIACFGCAG